MRFRIDPRTPLPSIRLALIAILTLLISGWTTCSVMGALNNCSGSIPHISSISPDSISGDAESSVLTVKGTGFTPQSQIMWNGTVLPTTLVSRDALQTTITQETFAALGGNAGSTVQISVMSTGSVAAGCSGGTSSVAVSLVID